jgi:hypothetical protein
MRVHTGRLVWLLALGMLGLPAVAQAQDPNNYEVPPADPVLPIPLGMPRYEDGGLYFAGEFLYMMQTNPMASQNVAVRGFVDLDGSITGLPPGTFVGSGAVALNTEQVGGPASFQPGFSVIFGWRFKSGVALEVNWWHLQDVKYSATASLIPPNFNVGANLADTFLFSPVSNFPVDYAGPAKDVNAGNNGATFGIWNAASLMQLTFFQRFDKVDIGGRFPVQEAECWRTYALFGLRAVTLWERLKWRTVDANFQGVAIPTDVADYSNVISQRLYGLHFGCGDEWYLGSNPFGALSIIVEADAAVLLDFIKLRARYQLADHFSSTMATHNRNKYNLVPEASGNVGFMWYPTQAIQVKLTWDVMAFFNTEASPAPIDFNMGAIDPRYINGFTRIINGVRFGISFVF